MADTSRCLHSGTRVSQKWHVLATPHALKHDKYTHTQGYHYTDSLVIKLSSLISTLLLQVQVRLLIGSNCSLFWICLPETLPFLDPYGGKKAIIQNKAHFLLEECCSKLNAPRYPVKIYMYWCMHLIMHNYGILCECIHQRVLVQCQWWLNLMHLLTHYNIILLCRYN